MSANKKYEIEKRGKIKANGYQKKKCNMELKHPRSLIKASKSR